MRVSLIVASLCSAVMTTAQADSRTAWLADIAIGSDDNIRAARDQLPRSVEQWVQAGGGVAHSAVLDEGLTLRLQARADGRVHARYDGLNQYGASGEGALLLRTGRGFYAPVIGLAMGIGTQQFASGLRDAMESRVALDLRQPLTTRIVARAQLSQLWHGSDSRVFDTAPRGAALSFDWLVDPLTFTLGYQYRDGAVVSIGRPGPAARANALAIKADDVFAGESAFSFDAQTHVGILAARYALSPRLSLDAQLRYVESDTRFDTRYHRWQTLSGLVARF